MILISSILVQIQRTVFNRDYLGSGIGCGSACEAESGRNVISGVVKFSHSSDDVVIAQVNLQNDMKDTVFVGYDDVSFPLTTRLKKPNEVYRDYILATVYICGVKIGVTRVPLRGFGKKRLELVLSCVKDRNYGHGDDDWYKIRWPGILKFDIQLPETPERTYLLYDSLHNCFPERQTLATVFESSDKLYSFMYADSLSDHGSSLYTTSMNEKIIMLRADVHQSPSSDQKYTQRWPGMLILTNHRLIFFAHTTVNQYELTRRFEMLDSTGNSNGQVHFSSILESIKKDLPNMNKNRSSQINSQSVRSTPLTATTVEDVLTKLFETIDIDGSNTLSLSEFLTAIDGDNQSNGQTAAMRRSFEIPLCSLHSITSGLYKGNLLDAYATKLAKIVTVQVIGRDTKNGKIFYEIVVRGNETESFTSTWTVWRRFSQFVSLHDAIVPKIVTNKVYSQQLPHLPSKSAFGSILGSIDLDERQRALNNYLQQLTRIDIAWTEELFEFLDNNTSHENFEALLQEEEKSNFYRDKPRHVNFTHTNINEESILTSSLLQEKESQRVTDEVNKLMVEELYENQELDVLSLLARSHITDEKDKLVKQSDSPQRVKVVTQDGRRFFFRISNSGIGAMQAFRRGCDGSLNSQQWCMKLIDEVNWLIREDAFAVDIVNAHDAFHTPKVTSTSLCHSKSESDRYLKSEQDRRAIRFLCKSVDAYNASVDVPAWRLSGANAGWEMCPSYPKELFFPATLSDEEVEEGSKQRSKGRVPTLTYLNCDGVPICRCAQPSGRGALINDDRLLAEIFNASPTKYGKSFVVLDARSYIAATANAIFKGKGAEDLSRLGSQFLIRFMDIENIHTMRSSLDSLAHGVAADDVNAGFMSAVDHSGWLLHIAMLIRGACVIARMVETGNSVLVHCSDGWDRTSQLCALSQVIMDARFRTMDGFATLIDKEFGHFGHGYDMRSAPLGQSGSERSPVVLQFLDCIRQLMEQYPRAFEFNEKYLRYIIKGFQSRSFNNFIGDCPKQRADAIMALSWRTNNKYWPTLWEHLKVFVAPRQFYNILYDHITYSHTPLSPILDNRVMTLWKQHFMYNLPQLTKLRSEEDENILLRQMLYDSMKLTGVKFRFNERIPDSDDESVISISPIKMSSQDKSKVKSKVSAKAKAKGKGKEKEKEKEKDKDRAKDRTENHGDNEIKTKIGVNSKQ
jgi:hypothetical protein